MQYANNEVLLKHIPHARLVTIDGAGHADCWAGCYDQNAAAILEFIGWELPEGARTEGGNDRAGEEGDVAALNPPDGDGGEESGVVSSAEDRATTSGVDDAENTEVARPPE